MQENPVEEEKQQPKKVSKEPTKMEEIGKQIRAVKMKQSPYLDCIRSPMKSNMTSPFLDQGLDNRERMKRIKEHMHQVFSDNPKQNAISLRQQNKEVAVRMSPEQQRRQKEEGRRKLEEI